MIKSLPLLGAFAILSACASSSPDPTDEAPAELFSEEEKQNLSLEEKVARYNERIAEDELICRRVTRTGSHMHRTRCRTLKQLKKEQQDAQDALIKQQRTSPGRVGSN